MLFKALAGAALLLASYVSAIDPISVSGSKFFFKNGTQFYIKGIAYQLTTDDPLVNTAQCQRDATAMQSLAANAIRVYHVDPDGDHTGCMSAFADAGIYLLVDLDTFDTQIDGNTPTWTQNQLSAFSKVMDAFASYDNTLGFFIGNEVITQANQSLAAPWVKAATRDLKAYRKSKNYRDFPVGYSAADIKELRPMLQNYLACGSNPDETVDMFGINAYEWCGSQDLQTSGYANLSAMSQDFNAPIFFSETGCITAPPRIFEDQSAILGPQMDDLWSGAVVYEWIQEANGYGLISYGPSVAPTATGSNIVGGFTRIGMPTPVLPDFTNLQSQWATLTPTGVASSAYSPSLTPPACPTFTQGGWLVNGNVALPSIDQVFTSTIPMAGTTAATTAAAVSTSGSAASASPTKKSQSSANGGREIAGMSAGLVAVMLGFTYWL